MDPAFQRSGDFSGKTVGRMMTPEEFSEYLKLHPEFGPAPGDTSDPANPGTIAAQAERDAAAADERRRSLRGGRPSTILTGPQGILEDDEEQGTYGRNQRRLLGSFTSSLGA